MQSNVFTDVGGNKAVFDLVLIESVLLYYVGGALRKGFAQLRNVSKLLRN